MRDVSREQDQPIHERPIANYRVHNIAKIQSHGHTNPGLAQPPGPVRLLLEGRVVIGVGGNACNPDASTRFVGETQTYSMRFTSAQYPIGSLRQNLPSWGA